MRVDKYRRFNYSARVDGDVSVEWETDKYYSENEVLEMFGMNFKMYDRTQTFDRGKYIFAYTFMPSYIFVLNDMEITELDANSEQVTASGYAMNDTPQNILTDILGDSGITGTVDVTEAVNFQSKKTNRNALLVDFAAFLGCAIRPNGDNVRLVKNNCQTFSISNICEYSTNFINGNTTLRFLNSNNYYIQPGDKVIWPGMPTPQTVYSISYNPFDQSNIPELTLDKIQYTLEAQTYEKETEAESDENIPTDDYDLPRRYLRSDTSDIYWIEYGNNSVDLCILVYDSDAEPVQHTNSSDQLYFWTDTSHQKMTIKQTSYPAYVYAYEQSIYGTIKWESVNGSMKPVISLSNNGSDELEIKPCGSSGSFSVGNGTFSIEWSDAGVRSIGSASGAGIPNVLVGSGDPTGGQKNDIYVDSSGTNETKTAYVNGGGLWYRIGGGGDSYIDNITVNRADLFTDLELEYT